MSLADLQRSLAGALLDGRLGAAAAWVRARPPLPSVARIGVYRGAYRTRLREVLESDHRFLPGVLGEAWPALADAYAAAHPSRHPNLNRYGKRLPDFLRARGLGFAADLAALGVAMADAFDAPEFEPMDPQRLSHTPPEQWSELVFHPNPSVTLLATQWPVDSFYQRAVDLGAETDPQLPPVPDTPAPSWTLVFRREGKVWRHDLPQAAARIFLALQDQRPLGEALEQGARLGPEVGRWFQGWAGDGIFL